MILVLEIQKVYDATFKTDEERETHKLLKGCMCDEETSKLMRDFLKGTEADFLSTIASLEFFSWSELQEAMKDMKSFPGAFFIKEIKKK